MSTMIEQVARQCERRVNPQWDNKEFEIWWNHDPFFCEAVTVWPDGFRGTRKQRRMYEARAAIEAMRDFEPTEAMMSALWSAKVSNTKESFSACWQAVIDAALKEEPKP